MSRYTLLKILSFFIYLLAQALIFNKFVLFGTAHAYVYVGFLLTLPIELATIPGMLIGLAMGLGVDSFMNTFGLHASASVLMMYIRPMMISGLTPQGGYPAGALPRPNNLGLTWFASFSLPLIFIHHLTVFFIEYGDMSLFWPTLVKALASTLYSFLLILLIQYLFMTSGRK